LYLPFLIGDLKMPYTPGTWEPNPRVRHGSLRVQIDELAFNIHNALSDAYYNYWKEDISHVVNLGPYTFDKKSTPQETLDYWNQLQRAMTHYYTMYFHSENLKQPPPQRIDENDYRYTWVDSDADPLVVDEDLVAYAATHCVDLRDNHGIDFSDILSVDIDNF
jgi:hypothetical protein